MLLAFLGSFGISRKRKELKRHFVPPEENSNNRPQI
jgi:hypothetical protein